MSSENGFIRTERNGGFSLLNKLASKGIIVKVLIPSKFINEDKVIDQIKSKYHFIEFRNLQFSLQMVIGITIVDREKSMIFEIKDDTKDSFRYTLGLSIFIEGKSTALSYVSIFDSLWKQTELYEQLKEAFVRLQMHEKMQKEFINTAAHELRTPIQPILGLTQVVRGKTKDKEHIKLLDIVIKNTKKLKKLAEDILDVTRIESNSLNLNKEYFKINEIIFDNINTYKNNTETENIKFETILKDDINIYADKNSISRVISNLIDNSIKFTSEEEGTGEVIISINIEKEENQKDNNTKENVVVYIKDRGNGIDVEILPRLFTKFVSKSFHGTGLGLYISKSIVEAHGGKIWGENNKDGRGATFGFRIPLEK